MPATAVEVDGVVRAAQVAAEVRAIFIHRDNHLIEVMAVEPILRDQTNLSKKGTMKIDQSILRNFQSFRVDMHQVRVGPATQIPPALLAAANPLKVRLHLRNLTSQIMRMMWQFHYQD